MMISKIETDTLTIPARCSTGFTRKHRAIIEFIRMKRTTNFFSCFFDMVTSSFTLTPF